MVANFSSLIMETPVLEYLGAHYSVNGDRKDGYQVSWVFFTHVLLTAPFGLHYAGQLQSSGNTLTSSTAGVKPPPQHAHLFFMVTHTLCSCKPQ